MTQIRSPRGHLQSIIRKVSVPAKYGDENAILRYLAGPDYRTALEGLAGDLDMVASAQASIDRSLKRCRIGLIDNVSVDRRMKVDWRSNPAALRKFIEMALAEPSSTKLARKTGLPRGVVDMARQRFVKQAAATQAAQNRPGRPPARETALAA